MNQLFSQDLKLVPILDSDNINAGVDCDSVDTQGASRVIFLLIFGADHAGAAGAILKLYSGASHGTKTTAMTFKYGYGGAAIKSASADVFSALAESAALQVATATLAGRGMFIEVNVDQITDGHQYLTLEVGAESDDGRLSVWAILDPMFADPSLDSVID